MKVYNYWNDEMVFEGEVAACREFILGHLDANDNGMKIFRMWQDGERHCVDVGRVFYTTENIFPNAE